MAENLEELLDGYNVVTLRALAEANGISALEGKRVAAKAVLVGRLVRDLFTQQRVRTAWRALDKTDRQVLERLLLRRAEVDRWTLARELLRAGLLEETPAQPYYTPGQPHVSYDSGYIGSPTRERSRICEDVLARLTRSGLVFSRLPEQSYGQNLKLTFHPGPTVLVPEAVRRYLPEPSSAVLRRVEHRPERVAGGDPETLLRDLYLYWDWVRHNETPILRSGLVSKRSLKAINQWLLEPDAELDAASKESEAPRLYLLRQLLVALGLLTIDGGRLHPTGQDPLAIPAFWEAQPLAQRREVLRIWPLLPDNFLGTEALAYGPRYQLAREVLRSTLAGLPQGVWLDPEDLLDAALRDGRGFLFDPRSPEVSRSPYDYVASTNASRRKQLDAWASQYVRLCLNGVPRLIGVVEVGYTGDRLSAFRLTPEAPTLLAEEVPSVDRPADGGRVIIQPSFQILAMGPVPLGCLARLDLLATRVRADRAAMEYRLTRESVYRALQSGMGAAQVMDTLRAVSDTDLPQNVLRSLEEWGAHQERIVFRRRVSLLQASDPALLDALVQGAGDGLRAVTPDVALLAPERQEALLARLLERGILPAVADTRPESSEQSVTISADGVIHAVHAVPGLHVRGRLNRFAEPVGPREWRLTPESVARGAGDKERVLALIEELGRLQRGPLPEDLVERLRTWGGYYGRVAVRDVTLAEFDDPEALKELLALPEVRRLLTPLSVTTGGRALALVGEGQRERLERLLAERGVRLSGR
jgi:hypothetical protein